MEYFQLLFNSVLLGLGLSMDAFSISIANGLVEPGMKRTRMFQIASVYAVFQGLMPLIGWVLVKTVSVLFSSFEKLIPWIALILLLFIGGKMIIESISKKSDNKEEESKETKITWKLLFVQGIATSIDALSVGFTISDYSLLKALAAVLVIAVVTLAMCMGGLVFGKKIGNKFSSVATIIGGVILILIGVEIFVKGIFGL
ncbi:MAG: manganese efflux pump MntP family protein [Clostridia bacterium]|nr:manganese efflux pump MntP family protein [Clostridia bacterium]